MKKSSTTHLHQYTKDGYEVKTGSKLKTFKGYLPKESNLSNNNLTNQCEIIYFGEETWIYVKSRLALIFFMG